MGAPRTRAQREEPGVPVTVRPAAPDRPAGPLAPVDRRSVVALQRAAGNAAVARLLLPVQRGKQKRTTKSRSKVLRGKIEKGLKLCSAKKLGAQAHDALTDLLSDLEDADANEVAALERRYHVVISSNAVGLNLPPSHPAGAHIVDPTGNLRAAYANVRTNFYAFGYTAAAVLAKANWMLAHPGATPGTVRCPGNHGVAHDVQATDMTIDHVVPVCQHWNQGWGAYPAGHDTTAAIRSAFYSDTANHEYLCRSCNSSAGSGGQYYQQQVGANFRA